jgi:phage terminase large subunit GpA-like protein
LTVSSGAPATRQPGASIDRFIFGRPIVACSRWSRIAQEWLKARGDPGAEQVFICDVTGVAYKAASETTPWEQLRDRAATSSYVRGTVPPGALLFMLGIDCQGDRVEWQLVGFGKEYRRYVIDYGIVDRHISDVNCQRNLTLVMQRQWRNQYGRSFGVDFAGVDGNAWTEDVWSFARQHPSNRLIMVRGRGDDAAPKIARVLKERNDKTGLLNPYSKRFHTLGVSHYKMALYRDLQKTDPRDPGYVSFPSGLDDEYFQEIVSERRTPIKRHGFTVYRWTKDDRQDNEALDTMVIATGAATKYGVYGSPTPAGRSSRTSAADPRRRRRGSRGAWPRNWRTRLSVPSTLPIQPAAGGARTAWRGEGDRDHFSRPRRSGHRDRRRRREFAPGAPAVLPRPDRRPALTKRLLSRS